MTVRNAKQYGARVPEIGKPLRDHWIYLGQNPDSPEDDYSLEPAAGAIGITTWDKGEEHAADLEAQSHKDVHQPTDAELDDIFNKIVEDNRNDAAQLVTEYLSRALLDNMDEDDPAGFAGWYWSKTPHATNPDVAHRQSFCGGGNSWAYKNSYATVRCVRLEPHRP